MSLLSKFFKEKKNDSPDVLGIYPEHMQVKALPERRYIKTSRFLAVFIIINIAFLVAIAGFYTYTADRVDISIANNRVVNLFTIDSSRKIIEPAEYSSKRVSAIDLFVESLIREYIKTRHEIVWDNSIMQERWDLTGLIDMYSNRQTVYSPFRIEADLMFNESRTNGFVRDVHLYELKKVSANLWEGVFDIFDMPIPDSFNPLCACSDNSAACISCKVEHSSRRQRFRVFLRYNFANNKHIMNPLGFMITSYNQLYVPIHPNEVYWGMPSALKPNL